MFTHTQARARTHTVQYLSAVIILGGNSLEDKLRPLIAYSLLHFIFVAADSLKKVCQSANGTKHALKLALGAFRML